MKHAPLTLSPEEAAQAFAALGSEQRLDVLRMLVRAGPEGLTMGVLSERTGLAPSTLTHHLRFLTGAKLVNQEKQGRQIISSAASFEVVERLATYLVQECCADSSAPHTGRAHNE